MNDINLIIPSLEYEEDAMQFVNEIINVDGAGIHGSSELENQSYKKWLNTIERNAAGEEMHNLSPSDTYFAVRSNDKKIVGIINIRHKLNNEFMQLYGGHIGCTVRPCERKKGYSKQMLRHALNRCRELNINNVLITCDPQNEPSYRVIESCGGVVENEIPYPDSNESVRRYWIDLSDINCD